MEVYRRRRSRHSSINTYGEFGYHRRREHARSRWNLLRRHLFGRVPNSRLRGTVIARLRAERLRKLKKLATTIRSLRRVLPDDYVRQVIRFI